MSSRAEKIRRRTFLRQSATVAAGWAGWCACGGVCRGATAAAAGGKFQHDGYCGDYCGACPNMVASEAATKHADLKCYGCKRTRPNGKKPGCQIRACAIQKGVQHCAACKEYPCKKLRDYHTRSRSKNDKDKPGYTWLAAYNLERIKAVGVEKWLAEQRERWSCPKCKTHFSWKDETCPKCHEPILSADQEAAQLTQKKLPGM
jgi:hypothetical protein